MTFFFNLKSMTMYTKHICCYSRNRCRNRDFASIIPHQPARYRERHNEVFLDFEAFLLASMKERSTLWIHSQIKACMDAADCQPDYCLDLFEPSGFVHGIFFNGLLVLNNHNKSVDPYQISSLLIINLNSKFT